MSQHDADAPANAVGTTGMHQAKVVAGRANAAVWRTCMWGRWYRVGLAASCDSMIFPSAIVPASSTSLNLRMMHVVCWYGQQLLRKT